MLDNILQRGGHEEILLADPEYLAVIAGIVGIKDPANVHDPVPLNDRIIKALGIEEIEIKFLGRFNPPESEGIDIVGPMTRHRQIHGHRKDIHVPKVNQDLVFPPHDHKGIRQFHPGVRIFFLETIFDFLAEKSETIKDAITTDR